MTETIVIPLNKLAVWDGNVRKTGAHEALEELIASLASHGLLQSLVVRESPRKGKAKGKYQIVAGQRRFMALKELVKRGKIAPDYPVSCHVLAADASPTEISLAENTVRLQMHPADQFEAYSELHGQGASIADIAARFGVAESTVQKLLKLARVSPMIIAAYRDGKLNLAQVHAFARTDDCAAQERVFEDMNPEYAEPDDIRDALTPEGDIPATDKRALYVGIDAYVKAGGKTRSDLFTETTFLLDADLLNELAVRKLAKQQKKLLSEGWAWVAVDPDLSWETRNAYGRIHEEPVPLTPEEQEECDRLEAQLRTLYKSGDDADDERTAVRSEELESRLSDIENRDTFWIPEEMALAGAFITLDRNGAIDILRGYVRPEDKPKLVALHKAQSAGNPADMDDPLAEKPAAAGKALSASLVEHLTAHRTAALAAALAAKPDVALAATVQALAYPAFYTGSAPTCVKITGQHGNARLHPQDSSGKEDLQAREALWRDQIPANEDEFWQWCLGADMHTLLELLAFAVAQSVDAVQCKQDKPACPRLVHAGYLAEALKLDMASSFRPNARNYFCRISKEMILAHLKEATGKDASPAMLKAKKSELADLAEKAVAATEWLPPLLRGPAGESSGIFTRHRSSIE